MLPPVAPLPRAPPVGQRLTLGGATGRNTNRIISARERAGEAKEKRTMSADPGCTGFT